MERMILHADRSSLSLGIILNWKILGLGLREEGGLVREREG